MNKLRCFVAMRFGDADTDSVYAQLVERFQDCMMIRRVDKINHNNDIDDQILNELRSADLVLADLTYTRPSVYFEAGYAQGRPIPVIYTARADHIGKKATDETRRIHFDLQMRNIVMWNSPSDRQFWRKLGQRIRLVTTPMLKVRAEQDRRDQRQKVFAALSQYQQLQAIGQATLSFLRRGRFKIATDKDPMPMTHWHRVASAAKIFPDGTLRWANLWVLPRVKKQDLRTLRRLGFIINNGYPNLNSDGRCPTRMEKIHFILTPRRMTKTTFRDSYPTATCSDDLRASFSAEKESIPGPEFWRKGFVIKEFTSQMFHIGDDHCRTDARGTFHSGSKSQKRMGSAKMIPVVQSYQVIDGIVNEQMVKDELAKRLSIPGSTRQPRSR